MFCEYIHGLNLVASNGLQLTETLFTDIGYQVNPV